MASTTTRQPRLVAFAEGIFPVTNLRDIIASKRATGRKKDKLDLELLELFAAEYEARHP
jgi:hypothetical protein